jgi:hypothetical protein
MSSECLTVFTEWKIEIGTDTRYCTVPTYHKREPYLPEALIYIVIRQNRINFLRIGV